MAAHSIAECIVVKANMSCASSFPAQSLVDTGMKDRRDACDVDPDHAPPRQSVIFFGGWRMMKETGTTTAS
jgi:hypothetical protein